MCWVRVKLTISAEQVTLLCLPLIRLLERFKGIRLEGFLFSLTLSLAIRLTSNRENQNLFAVLTNRSGILCKPLWNIPVETLSTV